MSPCPYCGAAPAVVEYPMHFTVRCTARACPVKPETARSRTADGARTFWAAHLHRLQLQPKK